jgi:hypothetical protein
MALDGEMLSGRLVIYADTLALELNRLAEALGEQGMPQAVALPYLLRGRVAAMSSESTPGAALARLQAVALAEARRSVMSHNSGFDSVVGDAVLAVLPALADEMERAFPLAADYLRSLAVPADDQEAQRP